MKLSTKSQRVPVRLLHSRTTPRGQLGAVVADDHPRQAAPGDQRIELANDPPAADQGVD